MTLIVSDYNDKKILIQGDRDKYKKALKVLKARWNSRIKTPGPGWLVDISRKEEAIKLINTLMKQDKLEQIQKHVKPTPPDHKKYHRSDSDSEDERPELPPMAPPPLVRQDAVIVERGYPEEQEVKDLCKKYSKSPSIKINIEKSDDEEESEEEDVEDDYYEKSPSPKPKKQRKPRKSDGYNYIDQPADKRYMEPRRREYDERYYEQDIPPFPRHSRRDYEDPYQRPPPRREYDRMYDERYRQPREPYLDRRRPMRDEFRREPYDYRRYDDYYGYR